MSGYSEQIRKVIEQIPCNKIFAASELKKSALSELPENIFYKTLERMVKQNKLVHLTKGLYYRPIIDENDIVPMSEETIVDYYVSDHAGVLVGEGLFIEKGISSSCKKQIQLISHRLTEAKKRIGNVEIQKTDLELNEKTIPVIQTLELLQNYDKAKNMDKRRFIAYLHDFVDEYTDEVAEYILSKRKYKKSTIAFLAMILDWYGIAHSMHEYLSPLSTYKIPTIEELRLDIPEEVQKQLIEYVENIKKIYKNDLYKIILYGSYAKGNYGDDSDIDIMILVDMNEEDTIKHRHDTSEVSFDFLIEYDIDINPIVESKELFYKKLNVHPFYKNVNKEGLILYEAA